jgi:probable HAF family extracellular repeat protein
VLPSGDLIYRKREVTMRLRTTAALLLIGLTAAAAHAAPSHVATGARELWADGEATAINDFGQVAGRSGSHAVFWDGTVATVLPLPDGYMSATATGINNRGEVVGYCSDAFGFTHAFVWSRATGVRDLGPGAAFGIDDRGNVVGASSWYGGPQIWSAEGSIVDLALPGLEGRAYGVNQRGQVIGYRQVAPGDNLHGFVWDMSGAATDLGFVGWAFAVNDRAHVFGRSEMQTEHGFYPEPGLWTQATAPALVPLGTPPRGDNWRGAINNMDWIASVWTTDDGRERMHGFVAFADRTILDLSDHVTTSIADFDTWVADVNELGQVVGTVRDPFTGAEHPVMWELTVPWQARIRSLDATLRAFSIAGVASPRTIERLTTYLASTAAALRSGDSRGAAHSARKLYQRIASDLHSKKLPASAGWLLWSAAELAR